MKTKHFDINKVKVGDIITDGEGNIVRILALDCSGKKPIAAEVRHPSYEDGVLRKYLVNGMDCTSMSSCDLKIPVKTVTKYVAIVANNNLGLYVYSILFDNEYEARQMFMNPIKIIPVEIEV